ncbi:MAG: hypothetical protein K0R20_1930 [Actinomycetia bacterium]|jgi:hypothetical protein|nr:hypothetical protein [Actinomycetes bacterium]
MTRRATILLVVAAIVAVPSVVLQATCPGDSCARSGPVHTPFCSLPEDLRSKIAAGYREGRSPDVLAVTGGIGVVGSVPAAGSPTSVGSWPSASPPTDTRTPIVFWGDGVREASGVPAGAELRQLAPTIAEILRFERPFPGVRSGRAIPDIAGPDVPRLVLEIVWKGVGTADLENDPDAWPFLRGLVSSGAGTLAGEVGSLPLDPSAGLTTIGTGGLPAEHGIAGGWFRNDGGEVVAAWANGAPTSVIATLPDDLDRAFAQRPLIGIVGTDPGDRGIVGSGWYDVRDRDDRMTAADDRARLRAVTRLLGDGYGRDDVPDVLAVAMDGSVRSLDAELRRTVRAARSATGGRVLVVMTATGGWIPGGSGQVEASDLERIVETEIDTDEPLVQAVVPGGLYLDQGAMTAAGVTGQIAQDAALAARGPGGSAIFVDAFQGFAVPFGRYC